MILYLLLYLQIFIKYSSAADTINSIQSITDGNSPTSLVSSTQNFELGFFSPGKSKNRYLGIWYKTTPDAVIWVANRNNPLTSSYGQLTFSNRGDLVLLNQSKTVVWSSNSSSKRVTKNPVAQLLDSGNLVLRESGSVSSEIYLWQSFDYPTDTILEGMKLGWNLRTGLERYLTSWKSADDPSTGDFTYRMDINGLPQTVLAMGSTRKFRSGTWNGVRFSGLNMLSDKIFKSYVVFTENESYYMFTPLVNSVVSRMTLNYLGQTQRLILQNRSSTEWDVMYSVPYERCDNYVYCGANGICRIDGDVMCKCLDGFNPRSKEEWEVLNWSKGCKRKTPLRDCHKGEGFVKLVGLKLPDLLEFRLNKSMSLKECREECLRNCSCTAYANSDVRGGGRGCLNWFGDLIDVRELRVKDSVVDLYVRLSASEMKSIRDANKKKRLTKIILVFSTALGVSILGSFIIWSIILKSRTRTKGKSEDEEVELPLFDFATIATATNNFSPSNMVGAGGFGPVYQGNLSTGQEIAVKRLSQNSGQGFKEFKNEIQLIAKLQHRNLVTLLGCCIQGEERILIYEYMPNKSLDHFIFDSKRCKILPWRKLFDIIKGIARGLLYLHRDSKLHIVHRDLKASNILLDNNLNPKISDFGLARMFEDDEREARTRRVVGTYGYMSPEYAIDGKFSIKSDVFSFGVLLLEIVSGKKNRRFYHPDHHHNLLGHAWLLWNEDKALDLMDVCFKEYLYVESQVLRCIHIGLLCVQTFPEDRPTISSVVFMLENEGAILTQPKQPGFFIERCSSVEDRTSRNEENHSENMMSISVPSGR